MIRKLLGLASAAVVSLAAMNTSQAAVPCNGYHLTFGSVTIDSSTGEETITPNFQLGVVSYEALTASGATLTLDELVFPEGYPSGGNLDNAAILSINLSNATFANPDKIKLAVETEDGNGKYYIEYFSPKNSTDNKVDFDLNDIRTAVQNESRTLVGIIGLVDDTTNNKISLQIPGTLKAGDKVTINTTLLDSNNQAITGGCISQNIFVVDNQFTAKLPADTNNPSQPAIDVEPLAVIDDGVTELYDDTSVLPTTTVFYNPFSVPQNANCSNSNPNVIQCSSECPSCILVCNSSNAQAPVHGVCVLPNPCNAKPVSPPGGALEIFEKADFGVQNVEQCPDDTVISKPVLTVNSLAESTVTLTLKGNFEGVNSVDFYTYDFTTGQRKLLCTANIDQENGVATCSVSGRTLFDSNHKDPNNGAIDVTFSLSVDGKTQLTPRTFEASAEISGGQLSHPVDLNWGTVMRWGFGFNTGNTATLAFKVPYMRVDNYMSSAIRIENAGKATPIAIFVTDPNGGWKFIKVLSLKSGQEIIIPGTEIVNWAKDAGIDLMKSADGRFSILAVATASPCSGALTDGCCHTLDLNIYSAQQVIGTNSVRYVPVEILNNIPSDLH